MLDRKEKNDRRRVLRDESIVVSLKWNVQRVIRKNVALHVPLSLKVCLGDGPVVVRKNVHRTVLLHKLHAINWVRSKRLHALTRGERFQGCLV